MIREQRGIYVPEEDTAKFWSKNFEVREYNRIAPKGKLAIDIGAHVGIWTSRLAKNFENVIAFEPLLKHIECHKKNCEGLDNIILNEVALSNKSGTATMTTKDINSGMSTMLKTSWIKETYSHTVKTRTLDSYDLPEIDFIKIDVEGWEEQVLEGAMHTILKYKPIMYIEIWNKNYKHINNILFQMGYETSKVSKINYICEPIETK
tara:strand:+ start:1133 stop:1750 length:618 start_codon:yes stop_codon:yes gene_type:complete